jgi:hypothetical protein
MLVWWCVPVTTAAAEMVKQEDLSPGQPRHKARSHLQNNQSKEVECLPCKHEALSSNPSNTKKRKKESLHLRTRESVLEHSLWMECLFRSSLSLWWISLLIQNPRVHPPCMKSPCRANWAFTVAQCIHSEGYQADREMFYKRTWVKTSRKERQVALWENIWKVIGKSRSGPAGARICLSTISTLLHVLLQILAASAALKD